MFTRTEASCHGSSSALSSLDLEIDHSLRSLCAHEPEVHLQEVLEGDKFEQLRGGGAYSDKWSGKWSKWQVRCLVVNTLHAHLTGQHAQFARL